MRSPAAGIPRPKKNTIAPTLFRAPCGYPPPLSTTGAMRKHVPRKRCGITTLATIRVRDNAPSPSSRTRFDLIRPVDENGYGEPRMNTNGHEFDDSGRIGVNSCPLAITIWLRLCRAVLLTVRILSFRHRSPIYLSFFPANNCFMC